ncbi:YidH family protein [Dyadobacter frigoris]|uniref:DUF202 domain-containing protein n=1 Tax=Dyadobacter frigoris TaxID=2576211 RepID=A0A4U6D2Q4_9BACT|nr:DUF202 domain-containing protein [Dyadobacter frigoris]TKT90361.1 DUF202 domain-containing protein [Dyadobacter frigoris]GLU52605.1 membrane protein [Dyadobacter frigoris]
MEEKVEPKGSAGDHLANERTFLAWIRTSIGIMGFGFVVVKFSLFVRQITAVLGNKNIIHSAGYSPAIGIILVGLGAFITVFSYTRYINTKKQLEAGGYYHSTLLIKMLTGAIFLVSLLLIAYLLKST